MKTLITSGLLAIALAFGLLQTLGAFNAAPQENAPIPPDIPVKTEVAPPAPGNATQEGPFEGPMRPLVASRERQGATEHATPEEKNRAARVLDFYNNAAEALIEGWYALPDALLVFTRMYLAEWQLARMPKMRGRRSEARAALSPGKGLFSSEDAERLDALASKIDEAAGRMRDHYLALENYMRNDAIQDDGKRGRELGQALQNTHADFSKARTDYLSLLESRAAEAENVFLTDNPLNRQIMAARRIFSLFRQSAREFNSPKPSSAVLGSIHQELSALLMDAGLPPFRGTPRLERAYRQFLKEAGVFAAHLKRGLAEGFYDPVKQALNVHMGSSRTAYNNFVREANFPGSSQ